jgi:LuxR family transcriptional regulator, maltose regulon positive regulatory protein
MLPAPGTDDNDPLVTVLCGPAGFGKTTLVSGWVRERRRLSAPGFVAWMNIDESDNDPTALSLGILAAVGRAVTAGNGEGLPQQRISESALVTALVEIVDRQHELVWLVLDDIHRLRSPEALHVLTMLLRWLPRQLRLIVVGRREPAVELHRLQIAGRLRDLRASDLAFSREQAESAVSRLGVQPSGADLDRLMSITEGWPVAVRLTALALAESPNGTTSLDLVVAMDRTVMDYLDSEVLSGLSDTEQEVLRATCVCAEFESGLASALAGREDTPAVLESLERSNGLVSRIGDDRYRQHPFVRAYLQAHLRRHSPPDFAELHAAAARWFADKGDAVAAARHAVHGSDGELAARVVREFGPTLVLRGELALLRKLADTLPAAAAARAEVGLVLVLLELTAGERAGAELRLARLTEALEASTDPLIRDLEVIVRTHWARLTGHVVPAMTELDERLTRIPGFDLLVLALVNRGTAFFWLGRHEAASRDLEQALRMAASRAYDFAVLHCLSQLSGVAAAQGDFPRMRSIAEQALEFAREHGPALRSACCFAYTIVALAAYEFLESEKASDLAARATELLGPSNDRTVEMWASTVKEIVDFEYGSDPHAALVRLRRHWSTVGRSEPVQPALVAYEAPIEQRMALRLGRADWAAEVERRASSWLGDSGDVQLLRARMHFHYGRVASARSQLEKITQGEARCHVVSTRIEAFVLTTVLAHRAGDARTADKALRAALELAGPRRALRPFYDAGPEVRKLLVPQIGRLGRLDAFVSEMMDAIPAAPRPADTAELTPREVQLLRELPSLATIEEIAATLYVSVNTVKTHLRNVYRKLGVTSRREAVVMARQRGLL